MEDFKRELLELLRDPEVAAEVCRIVAEAVQRGGSFAAAIRGDLSGEEVAAKIMACRVAFVRPQHSQPDQQA